jgi:hypothetical protein
MKNTNDDELLTCCRKAIAAVIEKFPTLGKQPSAYHDLLVELDVRLGNDCYVWVEGSQHYCKQCGNVKPSHIGEMLLCPYPEIVARDA